MILKQTQTNVYSGYIDIILNGIPIDRHTDIKIGWEIPIDKQTDLIISRHTDIKWRSADRQIDISKRWNHSSDVLVFSREIMNLYCT